MLVTKLLSWVFMFCVYMGASQSLPSATTPRSVGAHLLTFTKKTEYELYNWYFHTICMEQFVFSALQEDSNNRV